MKITVENWVRVMDQLDDESDEAWRLYDKIDECLVNQAYSQPVSITLTEAETALVDAAIEAAGA